MNLSVWRVEVFGCIIAGLLACPLYGGHGKWMDPLIRESSHFPILSLSSGTESAFICSGTVAFIDFLRSLHFGSARSG